MSDLRCQATMTRRKNRMIKGVEFWRSKGVEVKDLVQVVASEYKPEKFRFPVTEKDANKRKVRLFGVANSDGTGEYVYLGAGTYIDDGSDIGMIYGRMCADGWELYKRAVKDEE